MEIQYYFEIFGVIFYGISGALAADEKSGKDWFGVTFTAFITSLGGGTIRDVLLGAYPIMWIKDVNLLYAVLAGIILAAIFYGFFLKLRKTFMLFDTLGIALFTIVGVEKALGLGVSPVVAIIMGMFTAIMGGVIRDMMINELPIVFRKEIYATACLAGAVLYVVLEQLGISRTPNFFISGTMIVTIRLLALRFNLSIPNFKSH
ncbi:trimeric intracellular cation channel family protein [Faecalibacter rhinopitheci]|uniref:Trimeric intracellular cation channel family protein n=1 Tax=Faecalibacter rhinopitheci TaxID=2779678 RepID=A0A8J7KHX6_9FLAO|nr:trimeric intracellular cation channel family protein [Faecalibacter rhinopitheci]MBF0596811.1 trimeric intracellular cation channel family protein [Faecalibacter rhinopitheci]MBQ0148554.1 trimeric intracellular cation channel family protein [Candidatus Onthonaster equi]